MGRKPLLMPVCLLSFIFHAFLIGCGGESSKELTTERATKTIVKAIKGNGTAIVIGVRSPTGGGAIADIKLSGFRYEEPYTKGNQLTYEGKAKALFQSYTDGKWKLIDITIPWGPAGIIKFEYNIDVE